MFRLTIIMLLLAGVGAPAAAWSAPTLPCDAMAPTAPAVAGMRDVTARDLAQLRDIGRPDSDASGASPLAVSPDGQRIAFVIQRPDLAANSYCRALMIVPVRGGAAQVIDTGGEPIFRVFDNQRGMVFPSGIHAVVTPAWSPDGRRIAYLRRDAGRMQVRTVDLDTRLARTAKAPPADVEDVAWSGDGQRLVVASRPALAEAERAIDAEGRRGYLFDRRVMPVARARPFPPAPVPYVVESLDVVRGARALASPADTARLSGAAGDAARKSVSAGGWIVRLVDTDPDHYPAPERLEAQAPDGHVVICSTAACARDVSGAWWDDKAGAFLILRREGWGRSELGLYRWRPGDAQARKILTTADALVGCVLAEDALVCLQDGSARPRRLVAIDVRTGAGRLLFDANPEFVRLRLGPVQRLHWKTQAGVEGYGDLVLPPGHRPGQRHPMVIVQYRTRGFLRGGTGDEYPIYALAARGLAVLSFECPPDFSLSRGHVWPDWRHALAEDVRDWNDRRNILATLTDGIATAVASGAIDRDRIGLSGLSDGATTAQFALANGAAFKAVAVSSPFEDPHSWLMLGGEAFARERQEAGFPPISDPAPGFWRDYALSRNADRIVTPILMQLPDNEYLATLEGYWALKERKKPIELHVFPDEFHIKWQPAHRIAIYERNLDWFDYWLQDHIDPAPEKQEQYRRWSGLKAQRDAALATLSP